ncbi:MAG: hypothetical protein R3B09_04465 [Nannocystaceae bacterium]
MSAAPHGIKAGDALEVEVAALDREGDGVAIHGGAEVIVPGVFPGERAEVRVVHRSRGAPRLRARVMTILEASPDRREPPCERHSERRGACTGCAWQGADEAAQRAFKRSMLATHHGLEVDEVIAMPAGDFGYRWSSKRVVGGRPGALRLGSYRRQSHELADMRGCLVDHPVIAAAAHEVAEVAGGLGLRPFDPATGEGDLRYVWFKCDGREVLVTLIGGDPAAEPAARALAQRLRLPIGVAWSVQSSAGNAIRGDAATILRGAGAIEVALAGVRVRVGPLGFLQPNPAVAELAYRDLVRGPTGDPLGGALAYDLYAGAGVTTGLLRRGFAEVLACESNPESAAALGAPARSVADFLAEARGPTPSLVIANPPRAGLGEAVVERLVALAAPRLHLMSCSPQALAADLAGLQAGGYRLAGLRAYDTLPQTPHVELVAWLDRGLSSGVPSDSA